MELYPNQTIFSQFFFAFWESTSKLQYFEIKYESSRLFVSEIIDWEKRGYLNAQRAWCPNAY